MNKPKMMKHIIFSVQFSYSVASISLLPHALQHARPPCPSATPGFYSNSCPLSQWCYPTISSSAVPFSSLLQSFPASGLLLMLFPQDLSFFKWVSSSHKVANILDFSFSISPPNEHSGQISFRLDWFDLIIFYKMLIKIHIIIQIKNNENHIA